MVLVGTAGLCWFVLVGTSWYRFGWYWLGWCWYRHGLGTVHNLALQIKNLILVAISCYCLLLVGTDCYCLLMLATGWYCLLLVGTA